MQIPVATKTHKKINRGLRGEHGFFSHRAHRDHRVICSAWRSAARPFSRSTLLQKAIALSAKALGLHFEAEQIKMLGLAERRHF
jgi:hypothetical protein